MAARSLAPLSSRTHSPPDERGYARREAYTPTRKEGRDASRTYLIHGRDAPTKGTVMGKQPDPSMMPFRRGARDTGPPAAYTTAMGAYARAPEHHRDHMLIGALCAVLLNELRNPTCSFVVGGAECGCSAQWFEDRALCMVHLNIVKAERRRAEQRRNRSIAHRQVKGEG